MPIYKTKAVWRDGSGNRGQVEQHFDAAGQAEALYCIRTLAAAAIPYTGGRVEETYSVQSAVSGPDLQPEGNPAAPDPDSDIERKALFTTKTTVIDGKVYRSRVTIPTANDAAFADNQDVVEQAFQDAIEAVLIADIENDLAVLQGRATDAAGNPIAAVDRGKKLFGKRR